ncbi:organic solute transporter Ostalpha-domain-containing protein [Amylocystis lapponica]|nr:organic solute transporter Ostalpha-domain-containing protein [Amylocystis lapponica]
MANIQNGRCFAQTALQDEPPMIQSGNLVLRAHDIGWIITGCFTLAAMAISFWLIDRHLVWYTNTIEQRYIVRILFMVPIYAVISFASYLFWNHSTALLLIRDCYESTVLTAFFYLILNYVSHDPSEQKEVFRKVGLSRENDREAGRRGEPIKHWMFPMSVVRWKPEDGLHFLQLMKWGVLQYCVIRPVTTLAAVILNYIGLYCDDSWSPGWGHIYITVIMSISVTIAMYCLLQLYMPISHILAPQKPLLKLFAVKAVVFLTFWQSTFISLLETFNVIKDTQYMTADNIATGIGAIAETVEMMLFALLHIRAFSYRPYRTQPNQTSRWRSLVHAMNFKETLQELWTGIIYMAHRARGRETDAQARRQGVLEDVFGRSRYDIREAAKAEGTPLREKTGVRVDVNRTVYADPESEWLGHGNIRVEDRHRPKMQREKSDAFRSHVEMDWAKRGYGGREQPHGHDVSAQYGRIGADPHENLHSRESSWWRNVYARVSGSDQNDNPAEEKYTPSPERKSRSRHRPKDIGSVPLLHDRPQDDYEDPPPPSAIRSYRESRSRKVSANSKTSAASQTVQPPPLLTAFVLPDPPRIVQRTLGSVGGDAQDTPITSPVTLSSRSDSFLGRAFSNRISSASSTEVISTGPSSSQSHRTQVRLTREAQPVTTGINLARSPTMMQTPQPFVPESSSAFPGPLPRVPEVVREMELTEVPEEPGRSQSSHIRQSAQHHIANSRSSRGDESSVPGLRRASRNVKHSTPSPLNRYTPRRDEIVLPAPLAPIASFSADGRNHSALSTTDPTARVGHDSRTSYDLFSPLSGSPLLSTSPTRLESPLAPVPRSAPVDYTASQVSSLSRSAYNMKRHSDMRIPPHTLPDSAHARSGRRISAPLAEETRYISYGREGESSSWQPKTRDTLSGLAGSAARPGDADLEFGVLGGNARYAGADAVSTQHSRDRR